MDAVVSRRVSRSGAGLRDWGSKSPRGRHTCPRCAVYQEALIKACTWLEDDNRYHQAVLKSVLAMLSPENPRLKP